jgi:hypothetical protein
VRGPRSGIGGPQFPQFPDLLSECDRKAAARRTRQRSPERIRCRPHRARQRSRSHGEAAVGRSAATSPSHGSAQSPLSGPRRGCAVSLAYHKGITDWVAPHGPGSPDLLFHAHAGLTWTPLDGSYNLCHVVPSEGPRIRTGASSGPSKRYCRVFDGVSLTPQTLSRLTDALTRLSPTTLTPSDRDALTCSYAPAMD